MPTAVTPSIITTSLASSSLFRNLPPISLPPVLGPARLPAFKRSLSCHVALTADVSSSSSSLTEEELEATNKVGKRIRVKVPLKVFHVMKAPDLDLNGMEGVIKQYVGVWKGKPISANLPFKVEFVVSVEGRPDPVKFVAHLKEDEFEYLPSASD